jgi:hypothetical protein
MNIVSTIIQFLAPAVVGRLATALGISPGLAQKAIAIAVPAILAGLASKTAKPGGGQILSDILGKQDPGILGKFGDMIGGAQQASIIEQGTGALGSILGNSALGGLTGALGKFAGVGDGATKGLIGMLAPVVLGSLGQQQRTSGLDAGGLASLLAGQKDNIAAALPADFTKLLGGTGLLDGLGPKFAAVTEAPAKAVPPARPVAPQPAASSFTWWPWAVGIAAALALWFYAFGGGSKTALPSLPTPPKITVGNVDIGSQLGTTLGGLQTTLSGIKDATSATAALDKLKTARSDIDRIAGLAQGLPADGKSSLASYMKLALPIVQPLIENLLKNSTLAPVVKPALDGILGRLSGLAKT